MSAINTDTSLNAIYNGMFSKISNMPSKILFANADTYTGKSASETTIRKALAENAEKKGPSTKLPLIFRPTAAILIPSRKRSNA